MAGKGGARKLSSAKSLSQETGLERIRKMSNPFQSSWQSEFCRQIGCRLFPSFVPSIERDGVDVEVDFAKSLVGPPLRQFYLALFSLNLFSNEVIWKRRLL